MIPISAPCVKQECDKVAKRFVKVANGTFQRKMSEPITYGILEGKARDGAMRNMSMHGHTARIVQLAIMQEQLGKLSRAHTHNESDLTQEYAKLYKLMAMCYNYWIELELERVSKHQYVEAELQPDK